MFVMIEASQREDTTLFVAYDAFSRRFFFALFLFMQLTLHLVRQAFPVSGRGTSAQRQ